LLGQARMRQCVGGRWSVLFCLLCAGWVLACDDPSGPELGDRFSLAPGETVTVEGTGLRIRFLGVESDSRCALRAQCVWPGDGEVALRITDGRGGLVHGTLHTNEAEGPVSIRVGPYEICLVELRPYPEAPGDIGTDEYRALMELTVKPGASP
jgi:hypothetical protein